MKVFVTGATGQLGREVVLELIRRGHTPVGCARHPKPGPCRCVALDVTDADAVAREIGEFRPDAVVHCAAWTAVDDAEDADKRPLVRAANVDGTENVARACRAVGAKMAYISTDYVFDGHGEEPWEPDCGDPSPLNYYGETKLGGEVAVSSILDRYFVVRVSWVFGGSGNDFVRKMLSLADRGYKELRVVDDQIGTPTYTPDLARLLVDMVETDRYGYYHATNEGGYVSWADFAEEIFRQAGRDVRVTRVTTDEYGASKARRPLNSRLDKSKLSANGFERLPDWRDALRRYLEL